MLFNFAARFCRFYQSSLRLPKEIGAMCFSLLPPLQTLFITFPFSFHLGRKVSVGLQEWHLWEQCVRGVTRAGLMWYIFVFDVHLWTSALGQCQAFTDSTFPLLILKTVFWVF